MISLVRSGPTILIISAKEGSDELLSALAGVGRRECGELEDMYNLAGEGDTLIFYAAEDEEDPDCITTIQTTVSPTAVLCDLINGDYANWITHIRIAPENIVMRLLGNADKAIDQIAKDFKGREARSGSLVQNLDETGVLVNFTAAPLNRDVDQEEFYERALLIDKPHGQLMAYLRARAQEYLNIALDSSDWNEACIRIFDANDQYNLHYQRLVTVIQGLDLGVVVSESWETEISIALRRTEVYEVILLTPLPLSDIKKLALGLEYNAQGYRVVDFDVHSDGRKIGWSSERGSSNVSRPELGMRNRQVLLEKLPPEARAMFLKLDERIATAGE